MKATDPFDVIWDPRRGWGEDGKGLKDERINAVESESY